MKLQSTPATWGGLARALHWGMFLLYFAIIVIGYYMSDLPLGAAKMKIYALHKSVGMLLLGLVLARLFWRIIDQRPVSEPKPVWQQRAASVALLLLYGLMFAMPITGWLYNSAAGFPLRWFNLFSLPSLIGPDSSMKYFAKELHETGVVIFLLVIGMHVLGALKHHVIDRDQTLMRMLRAPSRKS
jgi:cytochrome b561